MFGALGEWLLEDAPYWLVLLLVWGFWTFWRLRGMLDADPMTPMPERFALPGDGPVAVEALSPATRLRNKEVARLRIGGWAARYSHIVGGWLDRIDRRLTPEADRDHPDFYPASRRTAWSGRLMDLTLVIALGYPSLSLLLQWVVTNDGEMVGLIILPDTRWELRYATICGIGFILFSVYRLASSPRTLTQIIWFAITLASCSVVAFTISGAVLGTVEITFLGAATIAFAGVFAGAGARAFTDTGAFSVGGIFASGGAEAFAGTFVVAFAIGISSATISVGAVAIAVALAIDWLGDRLQKPAFFTGLWATAAIAIISFSVLSEAADSLQHHGVIIFIGFLPLLNGLTDFVSCGASRWFLRRAEQQTDPLARLRNWGYDFAVALASLIVLIGGLIALLTFAVPLDGEHLLHPITAIQDIRANPGAYWWLGVMVFTTFLPTLLHFIVALYAFLPAPRRVWIAEALESGDDAERKLAYVWHASFLTLRWWLPTMILVQGSLWFWAGWPDLRGIALNSAEGFARFLLQFA